MSDHLIEPPTKLSQISRRNLSSFASESGDADGSLALKRQKIVADVSSEAGGTASSSSVSGWSALTQQSRPQCRRAQCPAAHHQQHPAARCLSIQQLGVSLVGGSAQRSIQQLIISQVIIIQQLGHHCHSARGDSGTGQRRQQPCEPWRRPPSRQQKQVEGSRPSGRGNKGCRFDCASNRGRVF